MALSSQNESVIDQIFDRAVEQNPHASEILKAFKPIIVKQRQLVAGATLKAMDFAAVDQDKLKAGVPVIRQINLLGDDEDIKRLTLDLAEAVKEGMPALADGLDRFCDLIQKDKINPAGYLRALEGGENNPEKWLKDLNDAPSNASFLMSLVSRVVLEKRAGEITGALGKIEWEKGYCPICGDFPSIALIEEEGGKRFLHCSSCGYDWRYTRVICPYCGQEAQQGMDYYYIEKKTQEAAFTCENCKKYLVTLYRVGHLLARDLDVSAISLVHLDIIMQDKGYEPMSVCALECFKVMGKR